MGQGVRIKTASGLAPFALVVFATASAGAADAGKVKCKITENGESATGTLVLSQGEREIARGSCGEPVEVPAGAYTAVFHLDGALDGPSEERPLEVANGQTRMVTVDFATGILEVRILREGRRAAGMAVIRRDGTQIGTLGSGVSAHLSTGTYDIIARYRSQEKRFDGVVVARGQRIVLDAAFE